MSDTDRAWAAGLFEGEGCFSYYAPKKSVGHGASVIAQLTMTDFEIVRKFRVSMGFGVLREKPSTNPRWKDQLTWSVSSRKDVERTLELLRPWLGSRRIARAEECLALQVDAMVRPRVDDRTRMKIIELSYNSWTKAALAERFGLSTATIAKVRREGAFVHPIWGRLKRAHDAALEATLREVLGE